MRAVLIDGPFDGALGTGDPGAPVIWVRRRDDGSLAYTCEWVPGRAQYNRVGDARYLFDSLSGEPLEATWSEAKEAVA